MTLADYTANNGWLDSGDPRLCKASFSGQPACSIYDLNALGGGPLNGGCINDNTYATVDINLGETYDNVCGASTGNCGGDELQCGTVHVIRAFAHAGNCSASTTGGRPEQYKKSSFTPNVTCSTLACFTGCTYTQAYWKTHGPANCTAGTNVNEWPVTSLLIGGVDYSDAALCTNLNTKQDGNMVMRLSHQLISALLNVANGATPPEAQPGYPCTLSEASALLIGLDINSSFVAPGSPLGIQIGFATRCLDAYNNGKLSPPHCP